MAVRVTADQAAERWARGVQTGSQKMAEGVARVTVAPGQKAAQKVDKWRQNTLDAAPKWQANVGRVGLAEWQEKMTTLGVQRAAQGATANQGKVAQRLAPVFSHMNNVLATVDRLPDTTLEDRIAKSAAFQRGMAQYRPSGA